MKHWFSNQRWWILRVVALPVHLFVFAVVVFFLIRLMPGDPVLTVAGGDVTPTQYAEVKTQLGLDGSVFSQFFSYLGNLLHIDFGTSFVSGHSVMDDLASRFPATLELVLLGLGSAVVVSTLLSLFVVLRPDNVIAQVVKAWARAAGAIPEFVLGIGLITIFYALLHWAPAPLGLTAPGSAAIPAVTGMPALDALLTGNPTVIGSTLAHLVLPVVVMIIAFSDLLTKHLVLQLSSAMDSQVTRFKIAAGASRRSIILSVVRRALPVPMTILGAMFGSLLAGVVLLEQLFNLRGLGQYAVQSALSVDIPALSGFILLAATFSLVAFLITDIVNMLLDPRRRPGAEAAS